MAASKPNRGWPGYRAFRRTPVLRRAIGRSEERPSFDGLCPAMTENDMEISDHRVGFLFRSGATEKDRTLPAGTCRAPATKIRHSFAKIPKLFYLCSPDAMKEKAVCRIPSKPLRSSPEAGQRGAAGGAPSER